MRISSTRLQQERWLGLGLNDRRHWGGGDDKLGEPTVRDAFLHFPSQKVRRNFQWGAGIRVIGGSLAQWRNGGSLARVDRLRWIACRVGSLAGSLARVDRLHGSD